MPFVRMGRPGLLGTIARTAVVAGTARMTANAIDRAATRRQAEQAAYARQDESIYTPPPPAYAPPPAYTPPEYSPPAPVPAAPATPGGNTDPGDLVAHLERLGSLRDSGVLSDEEFQLAKTRLLAG